jgi:hypothetical protein
LSGFVVSEVFEKKFFLCWPDDLRVPVLKKADQKVIATVCASMAAVKLIDTDDCCFLLKFVKELTIMFETLN